MFRIMAACIALGSFILAPGDSAACLARCSSLFSTAAAVCHHKKERVELRVHEHHMNHAEMVSPEHQSAGHISQCEQHSHFSSSECRTATCGDKTLARPARSEISFRGLKVCSYLPQTATHLLALAGCEDHPSPTPGVAIDYASTPSAPLRI